MALLQGGKDAERAQSNIRSRSVDNAFVEQFSEPPPENPGGGMREQGQYYRDFEAWYNRKKEFEQQALRRPIQAENQQAIEQAAAAVGSQKYQTPEQAAGYIKSLQSALGVRAPQESSKAIRSAAVADLKDAAHRQAVADASALASRGLGDSAIGAALAQQRGARFSGEKARTLSGIDLADQARMDAYNRQLMGDAMQTGAAQSQFGAQTAQAGLQAQQMLAADEAQRRQQAYQAYLDQINQRNMADTMAINKRAANVQAGLGFAGAALGAAGSAASGNIGSLQ